MGSKRSLSILKRAPSAPAGVGKNAARKVARKASRQAARENARGGGGDGGAGGGGAVGGARGAGGRARNDASGSSDLARGEARGDPGAHGAHSAHGFHRGGQDGDGPRHAFRRPRAEAAADPGSSPDGAHLLLPQSPVLRQASEAVRRLVLASRGEAPGATVKTLTLGAGVTAPRATHAVVSETLRFRPLLAAALAVASDVVRAADDGECTEACRRGVETLTDEAQMRPETAQVLAYAAALGEPPRGLNKAERLALRARPALLKALAAICAGFSGADGSRAGGRDSASPSALRGGADSASPPGPGAPARVLAEAWAASAGRAPHVRTMPKSVRVNALKWTMDEAVRAISDEARAQGVEMVDLTCGAGSGGRGAERSAPPPSALTRSAHVPGVLLFPPSLDLHAFAPVLDGRLFLQSLASCLPAAALAPAAGSRVLDACAAPGNKTSQAAAMVGPLGRVVGLDRSPVRVRLLQDTLAKAGAERFAQGVQQDFLAIDPQAPLQIRWGEDKPAPFAPDCVLLDPSCSGSGTKETRMDRVLPHPDEDDAVVAELVARGRRKLHGPDGAKDARGGKDAQHGGRNAKATSPRDSASFPSPPASPYAPATPAEAARVASLSKFQVAALRHALAFPTCSRVSYSTCSVYAAENEEVVAAVLPHARELGWSLADALPAWPRRGVPGLGGLAEEEARKLIRADPDRDGTDGFFVAVFERQLGERVQ